MHFAKNPLNLNIDSTWIIIILAVLMLYPNILNMLGDHALILIALFFIVTGGFGM